MTHSNGDAAKRFMQRPLVIPIALAVTITGAAIGIAYGYGQVTRDVEAGAINRAEITERIDRVEQRIVKELDKMNRRLDELVRFLRPSRWDQ